MKTKSVAEKELPYTAGLIRLLVLCSLVIGVLWSAPAGVAQAATGCVSGTILGPGQVLTSPSVQGLYYFKLVMQTNGDLVEYAADASYAWHPVWRSQTAGAGNYAAIQSTDGNFVVYSSANQPLWAAYPPHSPNAQLCLQTDGNLVIYSSSNAALWATNTSIAASWGTTSTSNLFPKYQCTWYANQRFHAWTQLNGSTGSYVGWTGDAKDWAYNASHRLSHLWKAGYSPRAGSIVVFQPGVDGAGKVGHVAWVEQVYPGQNKIRIAEMNFTYPSTSTSGKVDHRNISPAYSVSGLQYIYVNPAK